MNWRRLGTEALMWAVSLEAAGAAFCYARDSSWEAALVIEMALILRIAYALTFRRPIAPGPFRIVLWVSIVLLAVFGIWGTVGRLEDWPRARRSLVSLATMAGIAQITLPILPEALRSHLRRIKRLLLTLIIIGLGCASCWVEHRWMCSAMGSGPGAVVSLGLLFALSLMIGLFLEAAPLHKILRDVDGILHFSAAALDEETERIALKRRLVWAKRVLDPFAPLYHHPYRCECGENIGHLTGKVRQLIECLSCKNWSKEDEARAMGLQQAYLNGHEEAGSRLFVNNLVYWTKVIGYTIAFSFIGLGLYWLYAG